MTSPFDTQRTHNKQNRSSQPNVEDGSESFYRDFVGSLQEEWPMISTSMIESSTIGVTLNSLADDLESDSIGAYEHNCESDYDSLQYKNPTNSINFCEEDDYEAILSWLENNEVSAAHYQTRSYVVNYHSFQFRNVDNDGNSSVGVSSSSVQVDALIDKIFSIFPCMKRWVDPYGYVCNYPLES